MSSLLLIAALWVALAVDRLWGEPPARLHPVVGMGRYLQVAGHLLPERPALRAWGAGALAWCLGALVILVLALGLQALILRWAPDWLAVLLLGLLLKPVLAWRLLRKEVQGVEAALADSLAAGRERLSRLVSRDVLTLDATMVRESAIESLAENLNDSVIAPLFWFVLLGLPGAALYRYANTADAMWGYLGLRQGKDWTWAGKWAARADDVLSWIPARLTAGLLLLARGGLSVVRLLRNARLTPSPNSGWPMAAMALALDVRLSKPGSYVLHEQGRVAQASDTRRAIVLATRAMCLGAGLMTLAAWLLEGGA